MKWRGLGKSYCAIWDQYLAGSAGSYFWNIIWRKQFLDCEPYLLLFTVDNVKPTWLLIVHLPSWNSYAHNFTTFNLVCMHWCPVITSVQEWYKEPFLSLYFSLQSFVQDLPVIYPHMKTMMLTCENSMLSCCMYVVIFVTLFIFVSISPSYSSACQAYCKN